MATQAEKDDSIIKKTALLIREDKAAIKRLVEIKEQNAATEENEEYLRGLINSKRFEDIKGSGFRQLLTNTFLNEIYKNAKTKQSICLPDLPTAADINAEYFMDITDAKSVFNLIKRTPAGLQDIILNECRLLHSEDRDFGRIAKNQAEDIHAATNQRKDEAVVLALSNTLYKQILFGNIDFQAFRKKAKKGKEFKSGPKKFVSLKDLIENIDKIPDNTFSNHAQKNNLQNWMQGNAFDDDRKIKDIAKKIGTFASKREFLDKIKQYLQDQEKKKFLREEGKSEQNHLLAARLFLKGLRPELQKLIPNIATKEGLKCLKLIDSYIQCNAQDQFRKEFVSFLLNPGAFVQQKQADYRFDFKNYFKQRIEFNIRYKSGIDEQITSFSSRFTDAGILSKADYDHCKDLQQKLNAFITDYRGINLPDMKKVNAASALLERKLNETDKLIAEQQLEFATARRNLAKKVNHLKKFLGRNPTERNISVYQESKRLVESFQGLQLRMDAALVPEHASFIDKKNALNKVIRTRKKEYENKFNSADKETRELLNSGIWDKQQDLEQLEKIKLDAEKIVDLASRFYGSEEADILRLIDDIEGIKSNYLKQKNKAIQDIQEAIADFRLGLADLDNIYNNPENTKIDPENSNAEQACNKIKVLEEFIIDSCHELESLRADEGLSDSFSGFDENRSMIQSKITEAKNTVIEDINMNVSIIHDEVKQAYDYSQDRILLGDIEQKAQRLAEISESISYEDKNAEIKSILDIANKKIKFINSRLAEGKKTVATVQKYIEEKYKYIGELSRNILKKNILKTILHEQGKFPAKIAECEDWKRDVKLKDNIAKLEDKVVDIGTEIDNAVEKAIAKTVEKTKKLKPFVKNPDKTSIINTRNSLRNRKIHLTRLSKGKYVDSAQEHVPEVEQLIGKAEEAIKNFKQGLDQDLIDIVAELNKDFEWSKDKEFIQQQLSSVALLETDAANLEYTETTGPLNDAKTLADTKIKEIEEIIKARKKEIQDSINSNATEAMNFNIKKTVITDKTLIDKLNEVIQKLKSNINQHSGWWQDSVYSALFKRADEEISKFRTEAQSYVLERMSKHDKAINEIESLVSAEELSAKETKQLKNAKGILKARRNKYFLFDKDIFKEAVAQKIKWLEKVNENTAERINSLTDKFDAKIDDISIFLSKNEFEYTQNIPPLDEKQEKLDNIKEYCYALANQDLLDAASRVEEEIDILKDKIQNRFDEREKSIDSIGQLLDEAINDINNILKKSLIDKKVEQCYLILHANEQRIDGIKTEWKKDDAIAEMHSGLDSKVKSLRKKVEEIIFAKVAKIDAAAQQNKDIVDAAALHTPTAVVEFLGAEARLNQHLDEYSLLLRHEQAAMLSEKQSLVQTALKSVKDQLTGLRSKLDEDIMKLEKQAKKEHHRYTQHKKDLEKETDKIDELKEFLQVLQADEELARTLDAETKIKDKIQNISKNVSDKKKELETLYMTIISESTDQLTDLWKDISKGDNLQQSIKLISDLRNKVHKQGSWRMDDTLSSLFNNIDQSLNKMQDYQIEQANKVIRECYKELELVEQFIFLSDIKTPADIQEMQKQILQAESIKELLEHFKAASQGYDTVASLELAEKIISSAEEKNVQSKQEVADEIKRITARLYERDFSKMRHIDELNRMNSVLDMQKEICSLINMDSQEADFLTDYISNKIDSITVYSAEEEENIKDTAGRLKQYTKIIFALLEHPLEEQNFKNILTLYDKARKDVEACETNICDAGIELLWGGLESKIDEVVEIELAKIGVSIRNYTEDIHLPASRADLQKLLSIKEALEAKKSECTIFKQGKYSAPAEANIKEISAQLAEIQKFKSEYLAETKRAGKLIKQNRKELLSVFAKAKASELSYIKSSESKRYAAQQNYLAVVTEFGNIVKKSIELRGSFKNNSDMSEYLAQEKDGLLMNRMYQDTLSMQNSVCTIVKQAIDAHTIELMQEWHPEDGQLELRHLCGGLRARRKEFTGFMKSLLPENKDEADDIKSAYDTLINRVIAIKSGYKENVHKYRQQIIDLKNRFFEFHENSNNSLTSLTDNLPKDYIDKVKILDSTLREMQASAAELENEKQKDEYSQELLETVYASISQYTTHFADQIGHLKNAIVQKRKLQESGVLPSRLGGLKSAWKKVTSITRRLTKSHQQDTNALQELDEIKKYHESLVENNN